MNIIEQGKQFVQWLKELAERKAWDWRRCPSCGSTLTHKRFCRFLHLNKEIEKV